jgi:hypothetical protein
VPIQLGGNLNIALQWDQPYASASTNGAGAQSDLDLFLTDASGNVLTFSDGTPMQATTNNNGDPIELLSNNGGSGTAYIRVGYRNNVGTAGMPTDFRIIQGGVNGTAPFSGYASNINDGTTFGHGVAQGSIPVGAASFNATPAYGTSPPVLESFSSWGCKSLILLVPAEGIEPPTFGLQNRCTTAVLHRRAPSNRCDFRRFGGVGSTLDRLWAPRVKAQNSARSAACFRGVRHEIRRTLGPFAPDLDEAERLARLRCLRPPARIPASPRAGDLRRHLAEAGQDPAADDAALTAPRPAARRPPPGAGLPP